MKTGGFIPYIGTEEMEEGVCEMGNNAGISGNNEEIGGNYQSQGNCEPNDEGKRIYKGVLMEDIILEPGMVAIVKVKMRDIKANKQVCVVGGSEKLEGLVRTVSTDKVLNKGVTWVELLNCNKSVRRSQRNTYVVDLEEWSEEMDSVAAIWAQNEFSEAEIEVRREILRHHLGVANYKEYIEGLGEVLDGYSDVIALKGDKLGLMDVLEHNILLEEGIKPLYVPSYRIPCKVREWVEQEANKWEDEGIIRPSSSPLNFPLLVVPKKDGSICVCVNFRKKN